MVNCRQTAPVSPAGTQTSFPLTPRSSTVRRTAASKEESKAAIQERLSVCKLKDTALLRLDCTFYPVGKTKEEILLACRTQGAPKRRSFWPERMTGGLSAYRGSRTFLSLAYGPGSPHFWRQRGSVSLLCPPAAQAALLPRRSIPGGHPDTGSGRPSPWTLIRISRRKAGQDANEHNGATIL